MNTCLPTCFFKRAMWIPLLTFATIQAQSNVMRIAPEDLTHDPRATVIIDEHFDRFTSGTEEEPDRNSPIALYNQWTGVGAVDSTLTEQPGWHAVYAYPAGGSIALMGYGDRSAPGIIDVPTGDYSGDITITFRAKRMDDQISQVEVTFYVEVDGAGMMLNADNSTSACRMFGDENGWQYFRVRTRVYTSDNNGRVRFTSMQPVLIDDIKVSGVYDEYIAKPTRAFTTNHTETSFLASWDAIRGAEKYRLGIGLLEEYGQTTPKTIEIPADNNQFEFTNLDPAKEYYFSVEAIRGNLISDPTAIHAFGVATPQVLPATEKLNLKSFKANWNGIVKANGYQVFNYGISDVIEYSPNHTVFKEHFDKCSSQKGDIFTPDVINNTEQTIMDLYSDNRGWTGINNSVADGHLGCTQPEFGSQSYLITPPLDLRHSDSFILRLKASAGTPGDELAINMNGHDYAASFDEDGIVDFEQVFEESGEDLQIWFSSSNSVAFMLDEVVIMQDINAGEELRAYIGQITTDEKSLSCQFDNLDQFEFLKYGYKVRAKHTYGTMNTISQFSELEYVAFENGVESILNNKGIYEIERFNINGIRVSAPIPGINIIRYSDGTVRKVIIK